ncbi:MAG: nickel pincer cofactor biosynthesis protein LarB [Thermoplasmata archaeon]
MVRRPRAAVDPTGPRELLIGRYARFDLDRSARIGVPEVILAEGKRPEEVLGILQALHGNGQRAIVSRVSPAHRRILERARAEGLPLRWRAEHRIALLGTPAPRQGPRSGPVALLTAGTSDGPVADEIEAVLEALGIRVVQARDVGVAGLHRLLRALRSMAAAQPRIYLVCAGREGALPTVVAGLVRAPVVGVPTSSGYGRGGRGEAALTAMLQSCAPIAVVNIDAGVPAALFAGQFLAAPRPPRRRRAPPRGGRTRPGAPAPAGKPF